MGAIDPAQRSATARAWYLRKRQAADPNYEPRALTRGPSRWTEEYLTEPWAERKARRAAEDRSKQP